MKKQTPNDAKMRELIVHVAYKSGGDQRFGSTKLNKILFYADFNAYLRFGKSITGQEYVCQQFGPVPARMVSHLKELKASKGLMMIERDYRGKPQKVPIALRQADLSGFTGDEIALVDAVIGDLRPETATQVSDYSHKFIGWQLAEYGEVIPYSVALVQDREPTPQEIKTGLKLEERAKLCR